MKTEVTIDATQFLINGKPTYPGISYQGKPVQGLLMNSRMIQAIFDDDNPETRKLWAYPDTGKWDPQRNTREFCAQLPTYRAHGLLGVTVGLQGGGSIYAPDVYNTYRMCAFADDGSLRQPYFDRLLSVLQAADEVGMVVIVNYFYWKQMLHCPGDAGLMQVTEKATDWLLRTGYANILIDVVNEVGSGWKRPLCEPEGIHKLIDIVKHTALNGRRLLASASTNGGDQIPTESWLASEDFDLPHGNGCSPAQLVAKLRNIRATSQYRKRPRPLLINEDSVYLANCDAAVGEYCSWGYYSQGAGSKDKMYDDIWRPVRETRYEDLSGFQTLPVNWSINTPRKREFFAKVKAITSGQ
jgi:hypothetical protein